jgi:hypothetical protein
MSRWEAEDITALRGAVYRGDGSVVVGIVRGRLPEESLQLVGDGLVDALAMGVPGAPELAAECSSALRRRGWQGDAELVDELQGALGPGSASQGFSTLRPLPVDLEELGSELEGDPGNGGVRIDLKTGYCWPAAYDGYEDDDEDDDHWLYLESLGSHQGYRDMEIFIGTLTDPDMIDRLQIAITGKGAFRRFKDVLSRWPEEMHRYLRLADDRRRGRARVALADKGYRRIRGTVP